MLCRFIKLSLLSLPLSLSLAVDYNLAPFAPYPVPISQGLAGWYHLTRGLGYKPEQIFIGGDSFGAHTTLLLDRFLRLEGPKLDLERQSERPAGLILLSVSFKNNSYLLSGDNPYIHFFSTNSHGSMLLNHLIVNLVRQ